MRVRWSEKEDPVPQRTDPRFSLDNLVITIRDAATKRVMDVKHTAATCDPDGNSNLEIQVQ